jgi:Tfp pilus assembly protein PilF
VPFGWAEPYLGLRAAYEAAGQTQLATWAGAMATLASGDDASAEAVLTTITEGPAAFDARMGLGLVMEARGELALAADWYGGALALDPDSRTAQMALARVAGSDEAPLPALPKPGTLPGGEG